MKGLTLPIVWRTDEVRERETAGENVPWIEHGTRELTFYVINLIGPTYDDFDRDGEYSQIYSNGDIFIVRMSIEELEEKVDEWRRQFFLS